MANASTGDVWGQYASQLLQTVTTGQFDPSKQGMNFASANLSVDLGNSDPDVVNEYIYQIGNAIPAASPSYTPQSDLVSSYQVFLDNIDLGGDTNPNLDSQINIAASSMNTAQTNYADVQGKAITGWTQYKQIAPNITFPAYVQSQYPTYIQARNALSASTSKWQQLMTQKYGAGYEVIAQARDMLSVSSGANDITLQTPYNMGVKTGTIAPAGSTPVLPGATPATPASSLISSFAPAFSIDGFTQKYQEWQTASASGQTGQVIKFDSSSTAESWNHFGWSASGSGGFDDWFVDVEVQHSSSSDTHTFDYKNQAFSFEAAFTGLGAFMLTPGKWFQRGLIQNYHNKLLKNAPDFFGPNGSLGRIPTQAIIGFEPKITLTLSHSDYQYMNSVFKSETTTSINIGPFSIGSAHHSYYANKTDVQFHDDSNTIVIGPVKSTLPLLLGVISEKMVFDGSGTVAD
ncbi:hypothetical protein [Woodsholea maritima]|uniref:hypothetical protein n=1 Tax=Woodsholea maritima TaxID=240237 RepID=UPI0003A64838|nr:hypothetical protein [Woodsholea maritima]